MERKLIEQIAEGDPLSVALRGGAGWLHGELVWRREEVILLKITDGSLPSATPYALVFLGDVSALAVPKELEPPTPEPRKTGFSAGVAP